MSSEVMQTAKASEETVRPVEVSVFLRLRNHDVVVLYACLAAALMNVMSRHLLGSGTEMRDKKLDI